jgi:hypothetical protein
MSGSDRINLELSDLRILRNLGESVEEISRQLQRRGWPVTTFKIYRAQAQKQYVDISGLSFYAVERLFLTTSGVAILAQTATLFLRFADQNKYKDEALQTAFADADEYVARAEERLSLLKQPSEFEKGERALDQASIIEPRGHAAKMVGRHQDAMVQFLRGYRLLLPFSRESGCDVGIIICLSRLLAAALNEAWMSDEARGKSPSENVEKVLQFYRVPAPIRLLEKAIEITSDDRVAANHADGFALAREPLPAARMFEAGLKAARLIHEDVTLEKWQPDRRTYPVINEDYMKDAVSTYLKRQSKRSSNASVVATIIGIIAVCAVAITLHIQRAEAKPGPISALNVTTTCA